MVELAAVSAPGPGRNVLVQTTRLQGTIGPHKIAEIGLYRIPGRYGREGKIYHCIYNLAKIGKPGIIPTGDDAYRGKRLLDATGLAHLRGGIGIGR